MGLKKDLEKLAKNIAKREGKKSNVKIGDIREIFRHIAEIEAESYGPGGVGHGSLYTLESYAGVISTKWKIKKQKSAKKKARKKK